MPDDVLLTEAHAERWTLVASADGLLQFQEGTASYPHRFYRPVYLDR